MVRWGEASKQTDALEGEVMMKTTRKSFDPEQPRRPSLCSWNHTSLSTINRCYFVPHVFYELRTMRPPGRGRPIEAQKLSKSLGQKIKHNISFMYSFIKYSLIFSYSGEVLLHREHMINVLKNKSSEHICCTLTIEQTVDYCVWVLAHFVWIHFWIISFFQK